jgi:hypothetical protein
MGSPRVQSQLPPMESEMEEQKKCQCQSTAHGHRPGKCPQPAVDDGLCKECNEENRAREANPYGTVQAQRQK